MITPDQITKALEKGPLTRTLILAILGWDERPSAPVPPPSWWRQLLDIEPQPAKLTEGQIHALQHDKIFRDLCKVGQIVNFDPTGNANGPYALPGQCPACNGSGKAGR